MNISDINGDSIVQLAEIVLGQDIVVLATPEIAGLPYVISGLVAAGGLAAALSTADGLLLTIANALSHDLYYKMINPNASTQKRVTISKILLLFVALGRGCGAPPRPGGHPVPGRPRRSRWRRPRFFLPLVAGVFWKRANKWGAIAGDARRRRHHVVLHGDDASVAAQALQRDPADRRQHLVRHLADLGRHLRHAARPRADHRGVVLTPAPDKQTQELVEHVRYPNLTGDTVDSVAR